MLDPEDVYEALVARVLAHPGVVVLLGGIDSGKTTVARRLLAAGIGADLACVWVDTDLGQSSIGPPTTIGLRRIRSRADLDDPSAADELYFAGDVSPRHQLLPVLTGTARLLDSARADGDLVVVDTSGFIAGLLGQTLKFHKLELARPAHVVGLQRGVEVEPLLQVARRFTDASVTPLPVHPDVVPTSVEQRAENRRERLARYFSGELRRYRLKPTVFMPSLPPGFDPAALHGLLVGMDDGRGRCIGVGVLRHDEGTLRLLTTAAGEPGGLRLGSTRVDADYRPRSIDLRELFGTA